MHFVYWVDRETNFLVMDLGSHLMFDLNYDVVLCDYNYSKWKVHGDFKKFLVVLSFRKSTEQI